MKTALPIYTSTDFQTHRKSHCSNQTWKHVVPRDKLPIFAFVRTQSADFTVIMEMIPKDGGAAVWSITYLALSGTGFLVTTYDDGTELIYHTDVDDYFDTSGSNAYPAFGEYYLKITMNGGIIWYSEVFSYEDFDSSDRSCYNLLYVDNDCEIGSLFPQMYDKIYTDIDIGIPIYEPSEEVVEDAERNTTIVFRKVDKKRKFWLAGPEYLSDFFSMLPMFDTVTFTNEDETITFSDAVVEMAEQEGDHCEQLITVTFLVDTGNKTNCCTATETQSITSPATLDPVVAKIDCDGELAFDFSGYTTGQRVLACCSGNCFIYEVLNGQGKLVDQDNVAGNVVYDSATGYYWHYLSGGFNIRYLYLAQSGTNPTITLTGWCPDFYWLQMQRNIAGTWTDQGSPIASAGFADSGIAATSYTAGTWRYKLYNHSQTSYSNEITIV